MTAGIDYPVEYAVAVNTSVYPMVLKPVKGSKFFVPHSNIHSCVNNRGACTPFVGSTPGLSTHTAALTGNRTSTGGHFMDVFSTNVNLPADAYTVIVHTRFFTLDPHQGPDQSCFPHCLLKIDTAVGVLRKVAEPEISSTDAYIVTGVLGGILLIGAGSLAWAARSGRLDLQAVLRALTRDEVALSTDMLFSLGDITAFTVGLKEEILVDDKLKRIVPAAMLFLVTGWIASIASAWQSLRRLARVCKGHYASKRYARQLAMRLSKSGRISVQNTEDTTAMSSTASIVCARHTGLISQYERARYHLASMPMDVVTLVFSDIPLTAVGIYVVLNGETVETAVVIALCASTAMVGAKVAQLGRFRDTHTQADQTAKKVEESFGKEEQGRLSELSGPARGEGLLPQLLRPGHATALV